MKGMKLLWIAYFSLGLSSVAVAQNSSYQAENSPEFSLTQGDAAMQNGIAELDFGGDPAVGVASVSATVEEDGNGNLVVRTDRFTVYLSSEGEFLGKTDVYDGSGTAISPIGTVAFPPVVDMKPSTTPSGAPLPPGGLEGEEVLALSAALIVSSERIEEARLMDRAVQYSRDGQSHLLLSDSEISSFLFDHRQVSPENTEFGVQQFLSEAIRRTRERENRYDREWQRIIREFPQDNFVQPQETGPAEQMGRDFGPYLGNALYAAGFHAIGQQLGYGIAVATGVGLAGTNVGDLSADALGSYGQYIDRTGNNPFYPSMNPGFSPRPGKSIIDSMRDAFQKLFTEE